MKLKKSIAMGVLAVLSKISLLLQQLFLSGKNMSVWETVWFISTIALCFLYVAYDFWVFYADPKRYYGTKFKVFSAIGSVLVAGELAITIACILSEERTIFIVIFALALIAESVLGVLCTFNAVKSKVEDLSDIDLSRFVGEDTACTPDEEVNVGFGVGVSLALAVLPLLSMISMGFESLRTLAISYHIILSITLIVGFLCLNKLFGLTEKFRAERTKLKILTGFLIFDQLAITAFVWILYFFGTDCFRAFAVAAAIASMLLALVFATVPLAKFDLQMKYYLQQKRNGNTENHDETNDK